MYFFGFVHIVNNTNEHLVITLCNIRDVNHKQLLSVWQVVRSLFTWTDTCGLYNKTSFCLSVVAPENKGVIIQTVFAVDTRLVELSLNSVSNCLIWRF